MYFLNLGVKGLIHYCGLYFQHKQFWLYLLHFFQLVQNSLKDHLESDLEKIQRLIVAQQRPKHITTEARVDCAGLA